MQVWWSCCQLWVPPSCGRSIRIFWPQQTAVSYTHLDVYKRQLYSGFFCHPWSQPEMRRWILQLFLVPWICGYHYGPYIHLFAGFKSLCQTFYGMPATRDVYKRQAILNMSIISTTAAIRVISMPIANIHLNIHVGSPAVVVVSMTRVLWYA